MYINKFVYIQIKNYKFLCTCGKTAKRRALIFKRMIFPAWINASIWEMASCNVSSCSTAFRFGGAVILKGSNGFPVLKCLRHSMRIAANRKRDGKTYLIQPLHIKTKDYVTLIIHLSHPYIVISRNLVKGSITEHWQPILDSKTTIYLTSKLDIRPTGIKSHHYLEFRNLSNLMTNLMIDQQINTRNIVDL